MRRSSMSIFASILRMAYKLSGAKKAFALPEDALQKGIEKQNRYRGVFTPTDRKAYYETITMNGFHAFPDKEAAYREVFRVLRPGGTFCGCFYVMGEHKRTDWFVRHVYEKTGFFTPPYETVSSLKARLKDAYDEVCVGNLKSIAWFNCRKAE